MSEATVDEFALSKTPKMVDGEGNNVISSGEHIERTVPLEDFVHVGPGTPCGNYLRHYWHPILPADKLAAGRTLPVRLLGEDLTLYRGETGEVHACAFSCAHRGTQLSAGWVEGECIRCFYHGWKYDASGQCIEQPEKEPGHLTKVQIRTYPVQEYVGLIFVYLGSDNAPILPRFKIFENDSDGVIETQSYTWPCSYFNILEADIFHNNWVHRPAMIATGRVESPGQLKEEVEETEYGFVVRTMRPGFKRFANRETPNLMPNSVMFFGVHSKNMQHDDLAWRVPIDDEHFTSVSVKKVTIPGQDREQYEQEQQRRFEAYQERESPNSLGDAILSGRLSMQDLLLQYDDPTDSHLINVQDYVAQVGQGPYGLLTPDEHLTEADGKIRMLRKLYRREILALMEGRGLTQWRIPVDLHVKVDRQ